MENANRARANSSQKACAANGEAVVCAAGARGGRGKRPMILLALYYKGFDGITMQCSRFPCFFLLLRIFLECILIYEEASIIQSSFHFFPFEFQPFQPIKMR